MPQIRTRTGTTLVILREADLGLLTSESGALGAVGRCVELDVTPDEAEADFGALGVVDRLGRLCGGEADEQPIPLAQHHLLLVPLKTNPNP